VQRVSDIIGEISAAAAEQSSGIGQVNGAVVDLDRMTQQNAALVEESAAAAESLQEQAKRLTAVVSGFQLGALASTSPVVSAQAAVAQAQARSARTSTATVRAAPRPASKARSLPATEPVATARPAAAPAPQGAEADWEAF